MREEIHIFSGGEGDQGACVVGSKLSDWKTQRQAFANEITGTAACSSARDSIQPLSKEHHHG